MNILATLSFSAIGGWTLSLCLLGYTMWRHTRQSRDTLHMQETLQQLHNDLNARTQQCALFEAEAVEKEKWQAKAEALLGEKATLQAELTQEKVLVAEKLSVLQNAEQAFQQTFKALSAEVLAQNNEHFLKLADVRFQAAHEKAEGAFDKTQVKLSQLVAPLQEALGKVQTNVLNVEKERISAYSGLQTQIHALIKGQNTLQEETTNLVTALRAPAIRGRWGEMQLKRVIEMSGLSPHCDFVEQAHLVGDGEDSARRPDMIVRLPGDKQIVIDAKVPLAGYLQALEAKDDITRKEHMKSHARQVRAHIRDLSSRAYWAEIQKVSHSPEFVVLFLPGESFFTAALEQEPDLIAEGVSKKVIIATPATLIALLHSVAYGWRQETLADNAREISLLGQELYKRFTDMSAYLAKLGSDLTSTTNSYNKLIGNYERRILPGAKKFQALGNYAVKNVERTPRGIEIIPQIVAEIEEEDFPKIGTGLPEKMTAEKDPLGK